MNFFDTDNRTIAALDVAAHARRVCRNCAGAHPTQACPEVRQALQAQPVSLPAGLEETRGEVSARETIEQLQVWLKEKIEKEQALRHQLAACHEALGQSIAAMEAGQALGHRLAMRLSDHGFYGYPEDMQGGENPEAFQQLTAAIAAARAALGA